MSGLDERLALLRQPDQNLLLTNIVRGVEKEGLRVVAEGTLAQTPHPPTLGSALTHPRITTDYSEALLEFITPPSNDIEKVLEILSDIHRFTYRQLGDELLWVNSMPCVLSDDSAIPIAQYGSSNFGRMKTVYRLGLGYRYGRQMQTIAGIHYNFSLPDELWQALRRDSGSRLSLQDFKTEGYFGQIRNFRRYFWLLLYLFGASPAICHSFVKGRKHRLEPRGQDQHTLYKPFATSLRMGDLGYQSSAQEALKVCYNHLSTYVSSLRLALTQPYAPYETIGLKDSSGAYRQLSTDLLQIENEFYSVIRPKRTTRRSETPLRALWERGVEYVEVRCLDLNPYLPLGIDAGQIRFLDTFLLFCLLADSPPDGEREQEDMHRNQRAMVYEGRNPQLKLSNNEGRRRLREWGKELLVQMLPVAEVLDVAYGESRYMEQMRRQIDLLSRPEKTPAGRILDDLRLNNESYFHFAMRTAREHRNYFLDTPLSPEKTAFYRQLALESRQRQQQLERENSQSFDEFLADYYRQYDFPLVGPDPSEEL